MAKVNRCPARVLRVIKGTSDGTSWQWSWDQHTQPVKVVCARQLADRCHFHPLVLRGTAFRAHSDSHFEACVSDLQSSSGSTLTLIPPGKNRGDIYTSKVH